MNDICIDAESFLTELIDDLGFDLEVSSEWTEEGCVLELTGEDVHYALSENGEMLDAFETILFQIFGRELERQYRFICDADGFRKTRQSELHAMAKFAAQQVRDKGVPFTFGELNSAERRAIHLALKDEDDLFTESVGVGRDRRLRVSIK